MSAQPRRDALEEVDQITSQTQQLIPCWEELLKRAHNIAGTIEQRVRKATAESDSPALSGQPPQQAQQ